MLSHKVHECSLVSAWATGIMRVPATSSKCINMLSLQVHVIYSEMSIKFQVASEVNTTRRQGIKKLGISFGSIILLFSYESGC